MASSVNSLLGSSAGTTPAAASSSAGLGSAAPSEEVFLQLLVSQLQNQDPLNPTDSTTFVSQLAQFSELEQVIGIRGDIESYVSSSASSTSTSQASGSDTAQDQTTTHQTNNTQNPATQNT